jgi:hypothetical protein
MKLVGIGTISVAVANANVFDKNGIIADRNFAEILKILDKIEDPKNWRGHSKD